MRALKWYLEAAQKGHAEAQYSLGCVYQEGIVVKQDYSQAVNWYCKAAEQGHKRSKMILEMMNQKGKMDSNEETEEKPKSKEIIWND